MSVSSDDSFDGVFDVEVENDIIDDNESDVTVSSVHTEDLTDFDSGPDSDDEVQDFTNRLRNVVNEQFTQSPGPNHALPLDSNVLDYFLLLVRPGIFQSMVIETNRYAEQCQLAAGRQDNNWVPTTESEMRAYIGMNVVMGIHVLPELHHYWASDDFLGVPAVNRVMTRMRFEKLSHYFHLNDNATAVERGQPGYDPLHKIRPLLEALSQTFPQCYVPRKELSIDEAMVAFKGKSFMKQYLPAKPTKWGFKVWTLAESHTGYVSRIQVYTGRRAEPSANGLGYDVVMHLTEPYQMQGRHIYFDNFFSSPKLLEDLSARNTYACGTVRQNRKGLPMEIRKPAKMQRGSSVKMQKGNVVVAVWRDNRDVRVICTNTDPIDGVVNRKVGREVIEVPCPQAIINYNKYMGGVDLADQNRSYYGVGRESVKFWKYLSWYLFNTAIVNAFIIFRQTHLELPRPLTKKQNSNLAVTHFQFRLSLVKQLIAGFTSRKTVGRRSQEVPAMELCHLPGHELIPSEKKLVCRNCAHLGRKTTSGLGIRTSYKCKPCNIPLCINGCLIEYHTRHVITL
jgi:hypothetical protein